MAEGKIVRSGPVACACRCGQCRLFREKGFPVGESGCATCSDCERPSKVFKIFMDEKEKSWVSLGGGSINTAFVMEVNDIELFESMDAQFPQETVKIHGLSTDLDNCRGIILGTRLADKGLQVRLSFCGSNRDVPVMDINPANLAILGNHGIPVESEFGTIVAHGLETLANHSGSDFKRTSQLARSILSNVQPLAMQISGILQLANLLLVDRAGDTCVPNTRLAWALAEVAALATDPSTDSDAIHTVAISLEQARAQFLVVAEANVEVEVTGALRAAQHSDQLIQKFTLELQACQSKLRVIAEDKARCNSNCRDSEGGVGASDSTSSLGSLGGSVPVVNAEAECLKQETLITTMLTAATADNKRALDILGDILAHAICCNALEQEAALRVLHRHTAGHGPEHELIMAGVALLQDHAQGAFEFASLAESCFSDLTRRQDLLGVIGYVMGHAAARGWRSAPPLVTETVRPATKQRWKEVFETSQLLRDLQGDTISNWELARKNEGATPAKVAEATKIAALSLLDIKDFAEGAIQRCFCILAAAQFLLLLMDDLQGALPSPAQQYAAGAGVIKLIETVEEIAKTFSSQKCLRAWVLRQALDVVRTVVSSGALDIDPIIGHQACSLVQILSKKLICTSKCSPIMFNFTVLPSESNMLIFLSTALQPAFIKGVTNAEHVLKWTAIPATSATYMDLEFNITSPGNSSLDSEVSVVEKSWQNSIDAFLHRVGWARFNVCELLLAPYALRDQDGWRLPKAVAVFPSISEQVKESLHYLVQKLCTTSWSHWQGITNHTGPSKLKGQDGRAEAELHHLLSMTVNPFANKPLPVCRSLGVLTIADNSIALELLEVNGSLSIPPELFFCMWAEISAMPDNELDKGVFFSLDPPPFDGEVGAMQYPPLQYQRYPDSLAGGEVIRLLHHCDYLLKEIAIGAECNVKTLQVRTASAIYQRVPPSLRTLLRPLGAPGINRMWFETTNILLETSKSDNACHYKIGIPGVIIKSHAMEQDSNGQGLIDTVGESDLNSPEAEYARTLTLCMPVLMRCFPEFAWLAEVARMLVAARLIRSARTCKLEAASNHQSAHEEAQRQLVNLRSQVTWPTIDSVVHDLQKSNPGVNVSQLLEYAQSNGLVSSCQTELVQHINQHILSIWPSLNAHSLGMALDVQITNWLLGKDSMISESITTTILQKRRLAVEQFKLSVQELEGEKRFLRDVCRFVPAVFQKKINPESAGQQVCLVYGGVCLNSTTENGIISSRMPFANGYGNGVQTWQGENYGSGTSFGPLLSSTNCLERDGYCSWKSWKSNETTSVKAEMPTSAKENVVFQACPTLPVGNYGESALALSHKIFSLSNPNGSSMGSGASGGKGGGSRGASGSGGGGSGGGGGGDGGGPDDESEFSYSKNGWEMALTKKHHNVVPEDRPHILQAAREAITTGRESSTRTMHVNPPGVSGPEVSVLGWKYTALNGVTYGGHAISRDGQKTWQISDAWRSRDQ